jgi:hypothetical protein
VRSRLQVGNHICGFEEPCTSVRFCHEHPDFVFAKHVHLFPMSPALFDRTDLVAFTTDGQWAKYAFPTVKPAKQYWVGFGWESSVHFPFVRDLNSTFLDVCAQLFSPHPTRRLARLPSLSRIRLPEHCNDAVYSWLLPRVLRHPCHAHPKRRRHVLDDDSEHKQNRPCSGDVRTHPSPLRSLRLLSAIVVIRSAVFLRESVRAYE